MNVIDDAWIGPTEGQRPHKTRVLEVRQRLGADIVIMYRTRTVFEGLEEHAPTRAFLFDVASGESYEARGARSNNARITSDVFTSFLENRDDLSEADAAELAKVE